MFITPGAEKELNLPFSIQKSITDDFESNKLGKHSFDKAQECIFHLMEEDSFARFVLTDQWTLYSKIASATKRQ